MTTLHPELDLKGSIRPGLDILANEIVIALKKRTRFRHNDSLYRPGLIPGDPTISLLEYELGRIEHCHAELGRYTFASQESFTAVSSVEPVIHRDIPESPIMQVDSGSSVRILEFYKEWVHRACPSGENPDTYGETVTSDVNALLAILERVNLGKLVAESKFLELTDAFMDSRGDRDAMLALIVRKDREASVMELAATLGEHYELPVEHAQDVFRFMIETTVDIEVDYLRKRISEYG